jgi:hypothetical protein
MNELWFGRWIDFLGKGEELLCWRQKIRASVLRRFGDKF